MGRQAACPLLPVIPPAYPSIVPAPTASAPCLLLHHILGTTLLPISLPGSLFPLSCSCSSSGIVVMMQRRRKGGVRQGKGCGKLRLQVGGGLAGVLEATGSRQQLQLWLCPRVGAGAAYSPLLVLDSKMRGFPPMLNGDGELNLGIE